MSIITKSLIVGYQYTGKSWFCDFVKGNITEKHNYNETIGIKFHYITIDDIVKCKPTFLEYFQCIGKRKSKYSENKLYFWDTSGSPRFEWMAITMMNSKCVENVIFVYDPSRPSTLRYIKDIYWRCEEKDKLNFIVLCIESEYPILCMKKAERWCENNNWVHITINRNTNNIYINDGAIYNINKLEMTKLFFM